MLTYPLMEKGVPTNFKATDLLGFHAARVNKLRNGAGLSRPDFDRLVLPGLELFAGYAYLLPASKRHHHRLAGGLLSHSLDVACRAVSTAQSTAFDTGIDPSKRTFRRERWYVATIFAGLLHDAGKPLSDYEIRDHTYEKVWPGSNSIYEWGKQNNVSHYKIEWINDRADRHKVMSSSLIERLIPKETREWIREGGQDLFMSMVEAIACTDPKALLTGIVIKSDSNSVEIDLTTHNYDGVDLSGITTNVPASFNRAARYLVENGVWTTNMAGARIWATSQGVFLAWKSAVDELNSYFGEYNITGLPRGTESLGGSLVDHGILERAPGGDIYWSITPDLLSSPGSNKPIKLKCVKVINPLVLYLYDLQPKPVAVVIGEGDTAVRYDPENGGVGVNVNAPAIAGAAFDISAPAGAVSPMFSLDPTPALQLDSQEQPPVQVGALALQSEPAIIAEPLRPSSQSLEAQAPARTIPGVQIGHGAVAAGGKSPVAPVGISIEHGATAPAKSGLVIGVGPSIASTGDSAVEQLKARLNGQSITPAKPSGQEAQGKKKKKPGNQPRRNEEQSTKPEVAPAQVSAPASTAGPSSQPANTVTDSSDPFANLSGISALVDVDEVPEKVLEAAKDEWIDPFTSAPATSAPPKAPPKPKLQTPEPAISEPVAARIDLVEEPAGDFDMPGEQLLHDSSEDQSPAPDVSPAAAPVLVPSHEPEEHKNDANDDSVDLGLGDFDADIMSMTGMPQPAFVVKQQSREPAVKVPLPKVEGAFTFEIPDEFRFNDDPGSDPEMVLEIPVGSPSGFAPPPDNIEISVRESSAWTAHHSLEEVASNSVDLQSAPFAELGDFDLPEFNSEIVIGSVSSIQVESLPPAKAPAPAPAPAPAKAPAPAPAPVVAAKAPKAKPASNAGHREAKDHKPIAAAIKNLSSAGLTIGLPAKSTASPGTTPSSGVALNDQPAIPESKMRIGREANPQARNAKPKPYKEPKFAVALPGSWGLKTEFTPKEEAEIRAYLARSPELLEKLKYYLEDTISRTAVFQYKTFLQFDPNGFTESDIPALSRAMWLWVDFTTDEFARVRMNNRDGLLLSSFLSECMTCITGGAYSLTQYLPALNFDYKTQAELAENVISRTTDATELEGGGRLVTVRPGLLAQMSRELKVPQPDLKMALIATHETVANRQNLLIKLNA